MKQIFIGIIMVITTMGCAARVDNEREKEQLIRTDREFSALSIEKGRYAAFDRYMDDDAVMYRDGAHPFKGREAIRELLSKGGGGALEWEPFLAGVAGSGDLGYTLGKWVFTVTDSLGAGQKAYGYYVSIWRRRQGGSWKWVFDSGIDGPPGDQQGFYGDGELQE